MPGHKQDHFFVVLNKDGTYLTAYGSLSQAPKMYVRIGDARKWADTVDGQVIHVDLRDGMNNHIVNKEEDDLYRIRPLNKKRKPKEYKEKETKVHPGGFGTYGNQ